MRIAIVGSAGRRSDAQHVSKQLYTSMVLDAKNQINEFWKSRLDRSVDLVSGGAAFADHIAVSLYLMDSAHSLTLYLPAPWEAESGVYKFKDTREGSLANYYHRVFSEKICGSRRRTLEGIQKAADKGAVLNTDHPGFYKRNIQVGKVDALIAYTFSHTGKPKPGGTEHCWNNSPAPIKIHRNLFELMEK